MMKATGFSYLYRLFRKWTLFWVYSLQKIQGKPKDLETAILLGDLMLHTLKPFSPFLFHFKIPKGLKTSLYDLEFESPLVLSAFKDDPDILRLWMDFGLGSVIIKTLLQNPRPGNPRPRIQEIQLPEGKSLINAMGLPGKGVPYFVEHLHENPLFKGTAPIGISVGGNSVDEYLSNIKHLQEALPKHYPNRYYFELNISCPNTPEGQDLSKNPQLLETLLRDIRQATQAVIGVKLSPDQPNQTLLDYAKLIGDVPKTYINVGNTSYRTCQQVGLQTSDVSIGGGGTSGPILFKRTLELVRLLAPLGTPIMATGGIAKPAHIQALKKEGATLFGLATAVVQDPYCIPLLNQALVKK